MSARTASATGPAAGPATRPARGRRACSCPLPLPCECSYTTLLRARLRVATAGEPLLRNGHVLTASSVLTAAFGALFWMLATRWYGPDTVGRSYAALSAAGLLSGIGQLTLGDVLVRFVPAAGPHTRRLVAACYGAAVACSAAVAVVFLVVVPQLAPELSFLQSPAYALAFVAATAGYSLFVLQDGALTGLRRPNWVLGENALFAAAKAALLALFAVWALGTGILLSWAGALAVSLTVTSLFLFRRGIPAHGRRHADGRPPARLLRYCAADYLGSLFRLTAYNILPLLVLNQFGAAANAYFSLAWVIAYTLYLAALNMGSSLIVEAAHAPERLAEHGRRVLRHAGLLLAVGVGFVVIAAPWLLRLFGAPYAEHGTLVLRLLALSALPNLLFSVAIDVARARRALGWIIGLQCAFCLLAVGLVVVLLPGYGLTGVGVGWLIAECLVALPLLVTLPRWLPRPPAASGAAGTAGPSAVSGLSGASAVSGSSRAARQAGTVAGPSGGAP
ncbi:hypothetical protein ATKI12_7577 [Kitasatospora sp. Ki12]